MTPTEIPAYQRRPSCGLCPFLEEIGSTDTGRCLRDGNLHDIMEQACSQYPHPAPDIF